MENAISKVIFVIVFIKNEKSCIEHKIMWIGHYILYTQTDEDNRHQKSRYQHFFQRKQIILNGLLAFIYKCVLLILLFLVWVMHKNYYRRWQSMKIASIFFTPILCYLHINGYVYRFSNRYKVVYLIGMRLVM